MSDVFGRAAVPMRQWRKSRGRRAAMILRETLFLRFLATCGSVEIAAQLAGFSVGTVRRKRAALPGFAARWKAAVALANKRSGQKKKRGRSQLSSC
jgi:hypothetical protein